MPNNNIVNEIFVYLDEDDKFCASWGEPDGEFMRIEYDTDRPALFVGDTDEEIGVMN